MPSVYEDIERMVSRASAGASSPEKRAELGSALRALVLERYEMTKVVDRWEAVYVGLCEAARG